jgi:purine-nucleoside phosphorylase
VGVGFGSGHKEIAYQVSNPVSLLYADIPCFPIPTNIGHGRELVFGQVHGKNVILFTGRIHLFEGYRSFFHTFLGYITALLGCQLLISTNSCGAIDTSLKIGDFIIMTDHLNLSYLPFINGKRLEINSYSAASRCPIQD